MSLPAFGEFEDLPSCSTLIHIERLSVIDQDKVNSDGDSPRISDIICKEVYLSGLNDSNEIVPSDSRHLSTKMLPEVSMDSGDGVVRELTWRRRRRKSASERKVSIEDVSRTSRMSVSRSVSSGKCSTGKKRRLLGEQDKTAALASLNQLEEDDYYLKDSQALRDELSQHLFSHGSSHGQESCTNVTHTTIPLIKPLSESIKDTLLNSNDDDDDMKRNNKSGIHIMSVSQDRLQVSSSTIYSIPVPSKSRRSVAFAPMVEYIYNSVNNESRVSVRLIGDDDINNSSLDSEALEKSFYQEELSETSDENKENIESAEESDRCSKAQSSYLRSLPSSSLSVAPRVGLPWRTPFDYQFIPFKSERPMSTSYIQSGGHLRRSKRLRVPAMHDKNKVIIYSPDEDEHGLVYQKPVGIAVLPSPSEVSRRQKFLNRLKRYHNNNNNDNNNNEQILRNAKNRRTKRLQKLAERYKVKESSAKVESDGCVEIQLDPDVEWMPSTETHLSLIRNGISSSQQVIFPESATFTRTFFCAAECSTYVVPALSGIFPSQNQFGAPRFEVDANLTRIVSSEQERRQLHCDPDGLNIFKHIFHLPSATPGKPRYAVQIERYAIPLEQPCTIFIPKGIPYKFLNATKEDLNLCRFRLFNWILNCYCFSSSNWFYDLHRVYISLLLFILDLIIFLFSPNKFSLLLILLCCTHHK
ncbi:unnamed protein product [Heterobilharzia americana]|nr:unnamed protein product [Heterobilharzia americana]